MAIDLTEDENLFGDAIATHVEINRDELSTALYAALKNVTLEGFVAMFTNRFEAVVDYANLCAGESAGQRISLLFNPHRLDTGTKRFPISLYAKLSDASFISGLARVVLLNKKKGATKDLLYASVGMGVQGTSYVQEFPPAVARDAALHNGMSKRCRVLDPCAGWGGRMLGFSAVVDSYTCCEPSARTAAGLRQILQFIKTYRATFNADIHEAPFEDVDLPAASFDFAMTSPPYYDTEHYAPGEKANSMNRYASFSDWVGGFYAPLIHRTMRALKPGSVFIINIGSRIYPLNDKLIEISENKYEVSKDKQRLSASNGLGKQGEGETFYEVKNPGSWIEPDVLPVIVSLPCLVEAAIPSALVDVVKLPDLVVEIPQSTAPASAADAADTFNPLDAFLADLGPEPAKTSTNQSDDADTVYQNDTPVAAVVLQLPTQRHEQEQLSAHAIEKQFISRGNNIWARNGKLVVNNASTLTDDDRALIKARRDELLVIVPTFPEQTIQKPQTIVQFLGEAPTIGAPASWKLESPPSLDGISEIELDFETDGLDWYKRDIMIGWALRLPNGQKKYYPVRHRNGGEQIDEDIARRWFQTELKNKRITNASTRFEVHTARAFGADLVEQGCTFSDVMHYAALLDDHRKRFSLNELAKDFLNREKEGMDLDPTRMADYEPWVVAARAEGDVETVAQLKAIMYPMLDEQDLHRVRALEDQIIPVVCEMEKNGAPIDVELLTRYAHDSEQHYYRLIKEVSNEAGFNFDDTDASWIRLFERFKIPLVFAKSIENDRIVESSKPTFKDSVLERIEHPVIKTARFAAQLDSLRSKIYKPYLENVDSNGILRVEFNQLRIADEKGERGTVSGRFSAPYVQQVPNHDNHTETFGDLYYPRELYVPGSGLFFAGDAQQIEYRIFASHAKNKRMLEAYAKDPRVSFHKYMWPLITAFKKEFSYSSMKNFNFMRIYGGGIVKTAVMMKFITEYEGMEIEVMKAQRTSPKLSLARDIEDIYNREMPETRPLTRRAMHLAMPECNKFCNRADDLHKLKHRGYVKTVLGRRSRFPTAYKIHKALNAIIQGSAADIMKTKLVELHAQRKSLGFTMRMTVHDEVTGDVADAESAQRIEELLNVQSIEMLVPILWSTGTGKNWAEAK